MPKPKLNYWDLPDLVQYITKIRQGNDMIDRTGAVNVENETKLPWPIRLGTICDENQIGQWRDG